MEVSVLMNLSTLLVEFTVTETENLILRIRDFGNKGSNIGIKNCLLNFITDSKISLLFFLAFTVLILRLFGRVIPKWVYKETQQNPILDYNYRIASKIAKCSTGKHVNLYHVLNMTK